jgi:hypothetical protein
MIPVSTFTSYYCTPRSNNILLGNHKRTAVSNMIYNHSLINGYAKTSWNSICQARINRKVYLSRKMQKTCASSPWCIYNPKWACFCSLRGIMFITHSKDYSNSHGLHLCKNEQKTLRNPRTNTCSDFSLNAKDAFRLLKNLWSGSGWSCVLFYKCLTFSLLNGCL